MPTRRKDTLYLGPGIEIPVDAVTARWGILGTSGSGKSNVEAVLAEELWRVGVPWVVIDPKGDWWGLRHAADGQGPGLPVPILGGLHGDIPLEPTAGAVVADMLVDQNVSAIIDISQFSEGQKRQFLVAFCHQLFARHQADPHVRHVIFEEAHRYIPQSVTATTAEMKEAAAKIALEGRVFGLGCSAASQRSSRIHKDVLTQWDILIGLRAGAKLDREAVGGWFEEHPEVSREILPTLDSLPNGEGWLLSPQLLGRRDRVRFYRRSTFDSGQAPKVGQRKVSPKGVADVDLAGLKEAMAATIERAEAADPEKLRAKLRKAEADRDRLARELEAERERTTAEPVAVPEPYVPPQIRHGIAGAVDRLVVLEQVAREVTEARAAVADLLAQVDELARDQSRSTATKPAPKRPPTVAPPRPAPVQAVATSRDTPRPVAASNGARPNPKDEENLAQRILIALAMHGPLDRRQLGIHTGKKITGGYFKNTLGKLRSAGYVEGGGTQQITAAGLAELGEYDPLPEGPALIEWWCQEVGGIGGRMIRTTLEAWPTVLSRDELAEAVDAEATGGYFKNTLGKLRSLGLIEKGSTAPTATLIEARA